MASALDSLFAYYKLIGVLKDPNRGIPFPKGLKPLLDQHNDNGINNIAAWRVLAGTSQVAGFTAYGSPASKMDLGSITNKTATMLHTFQSINVPFYLMQTLQKVDNIQQGEGPAKQIVEWFTDLNVDKIRNLVQSSVVQMIGGGKIFIGSNNQLLPTAVGAVNTVDSGILASHQSQIALGTGGANIINPLWSDPNALIAQQIMNLKAAAQKESRREINTAFYGRNVFQYILQNESLKSLTKNESYYKGFSTGAIPDGFLGIEKWVEIPISFYTDANGTQQETFSANLIVFAPSISSDWWDFCRGQYFIPKAAIGSVAGDVGGILSMIDPVRGEFQYAVLGHNPAAIEVYFGHTWLPVITVPSAVFQATVG